MNAVPIPAVLDLWSLGHSARQIAEMLGFSSCKRVNQIVDQARDIGDPRATLHVGKNGRPIGRSALVLADHPEVEVVQALPAAKCRHGHLKTPENVDRHSNCLECKRAREREARR